MVLVTMYDFGIKFHCNKNFVKGSFLFLARITAASFFALAKVKKIQRIAGLAPK
jgi:hypothetical protein